MNAVETPRLSASTDEVRLSPKGPWLKGLLWGSERSSARGVVRLRRGALKRAVGALRGHYPGGIEGSRGS